MNKKDYWVTKREEGWAALREGASRASEIFDTQDEAEDFAHKVLVNSGGGELITQGRDGRIRSKDTINSKDPLPPRDKEH